MEKGIKRSLEDEIYNGSNNKKCKLLFETTKSSLENLANETFVEIFEYLDMNEIYFGFFDLNYRFESLLIYFNIPFEIDHSRISKSQFDFYEKNVFQPNKDQMKILRLSNPFTVDLIFSPIRLIRDLIKIEKLIFDQINSKYLNNILKHLIHLPKLHSLILSVIDNIPNPTILFREIFRLKNFKYLKLKYGIEDKEKIFPIDFNEFEESSIEYLIINSPFRSESFGKLFLYLPKLVYLSLNYLSGSNSFGIDLTPIELKDLKYLSLNLHSIRFNQFKKLIENFFSHIEILRVTTSNDPSYSHAKQWEDLIRSSMTNLRHFDLENNYSGAMDRFLYLCLSGEFQSKFWKDKQFFFLHQYDDDDQRQKNGIFYSTNPYRRKHFRFHCQMDHRIDSSIQKQNYNSVKHIHISGKRSPNNSNIYFPNLFELTIENSEKNYSRSMLTDLDHILPLKQLKQINIHCNDYPIEQIINLINLTPNLNLLKWNFQSIDQKKLKFIEQSETFRSLSNTNQIKNFSILHCCSFDEIQFFIHLFPRLESLQTGVIRKQILQITRDLLLKMDHLLFFHITNIIKTYLQKLNFLIKSEYLLDDYLIKFIDQDLYLWW